MSLGVPVLGHGALGAEVQSLLFICFSFRVTVRMEPQASQDNLGPRVSG